MKTVTDKLQRVLNAAARVVSDTRKRKFHRGTPARRTALAGCAGGGAIEPFLTNQGSLGSAVSSHSGVRRNR